MRLSAEERYESKVNRSGGPNACHVWKGARFKGGRNGRSRPFARRYGTFSFNNRNVPAHRWAYAHYVGPIPEGMEVCHTCDNPPCQNRRHWFLGTRLDNEHDKISKGRFRCVRGQSHYKAKLTNRQVRAIRRRYTGKRGEQTLIARQYNVSPSLINMIVRGQHRAEIGY